MTELLRAVLFLGESKMEVVARDGDKARTICFNWTGASDLVPADWASQVDQECDLQRDYEKRKAEGRTIL